MTSDIDWICLRCGKAHTFNIDNCMKCKWTRPEKPLRKLGESE